MKIRNCFVSNSSSSSFIIKKSSLDYFQIANLRKHVEYANSRGLDCGSTDIEDSWDIEENDEYINGKTFCDNFSIGPVIRDLGITDVEFFDDYSGDYYED